jgi:hypothetical protein
MGFRSISHPNINSLSEWLAASSGLLSFWNIHHSGFVIPAKAGIQSTKKLSRNTGLHQRHIG